VALFLPPRRHQLITAS
jgi:hypothetical protein